MNKIILKNIDDTINFAKKIAHNYANKPILIYLKGDLGLGKTTWSQAFINEFAQENTLVSSPTYSLVNEYNFEKKIFHFDLYRLESFEEFTQMGLDELLENEHSFRIVEWPEIIENFYKPDLIIELKSENNHRIAYITQ